ncbi:MAG: hypothetical protein KZQ83_02855 [gamma proteobacterium symbiont of Taylorina sp.]|nr:hypothetical protein [gamma proteobacterium symbiont of Taylorina sp.]
MKIFYRISLSFIIVSLLLISGCVADYHFSASSETSKETITGTFIYNEKGSGDILINAKTSTDADCNGKAYLNWNYKIYWGRKGTFNLSCENNLNIDGTFEAFSGNINQGHGSGQDQHGNQYDFVFGFKQNK